MFNMLLIIGTIFSQSLFGGPSSNLQNNVDDSNSEHKQQPINVIEDIIKGEPVEEVEEEDELIKILDHKRRKRDQVVTRMKVEFKLGDVMWTSTENARADNAELVEEYLASLKTTQANEKLSKEVEVSNPY